MHRSASSAQRRPRLLRASMTEPSLFTSSAITSLDMPDMAQQSSMTGRASGRSSPTSSTSPSYHRRAADLLSHVAYMSSCATSPVPSFVSGTGTTSRSRGSLSSSGSSATRSLSYGAGSATSSSRATAHAPAPADACYRRSGPDAVFGSSPASTHTSASMEDMQMQSRYAGAGSANYYSFPSFDTWDPDCEKEDDIDG